MCRSIRTLRTGHIRSSDEDIHAAALQFVRKISGYRQPARINADAFEAALDETAVASQKLMESLKLPGRGSATTSYQ